MMRQLDNVPIGIRHNSAANWHIGILPNWHIIYIGTLLKFAREMEFDVLKIYLCHL